jgi:hypothetical protein
MDQVGDLLDAVWPGEKYAPLSDGGAYAACFRVKSAGDVLPTSIVAVGEVSAGADVILEKHILRHELPAEGYGVSCMDFGFRGNERLRIRVHSNGQSDLWLDWVAVTRGVRGRDWAVAGCWLVLLAVFTAGYCRACGWSEPQELSRDMGFRGSPPSRERCGLIFGAVSIGIVLLIALAMVTYFRSLWYPRAFEAEQMSRTTGEVVVDGHASGGEAVMARARDPHGMLAYGPYEFFPPGEYRVRFRLKTGGEIRGRELAVLDVAGSATGVLASRGVGRLDSLAEDRFRDFRLAVVNPVTQALEFRVRFNGREDLWLDKITVERLD